MKEQFGYNAVPIEINSVFKGSNSVPTDLMLSPNKSSIIKFKIDKLLVFVLKLDNKQLKCKYNQIRYYSISYY